MVRRTWSLLETQLGLRGVLVMPYPHFSYQISPGYDRPSLESTLQELSAQIAPFSVRTTGLGQFGDPWPVMFIAIERSAALATLHERIWKSCLPHAMDPVAYYQPANWIPHITLAHGEEHNTRPLTDGEVSKIRSTLAGEDYHWALCIDNLALVWDKGTIQEPVMTLPLRGH